MWTPEQLGKARPRGLDLKYFCYPTALLGVTIRVEGEDPEEVCEVANQIEEKLGAKANG